MNEELRQQLKQVLFHEEDIESIAPLIDAHVAQKVKESYSDVGNYAADSGDTKLMSFIDSRLQQPPTLESDGKDE